MMLVCLDVEGVLLPEMWICLAEATSIPELRRTTREEPDYALLMAQRLEILRENDIRREDLEKVVAKVVPLPGAKRFLHAVRRRWPCALVSDSFYEFINPLAAKLNYPTVFCHNLLFEPDGQLRGWRPRIMDQKPIVVKALQSTAFKVAAAGDSFNDLGMLDAADAGFLIHAPKNIRDLRPDIPTADSLQDLLRLLTETDARFA